MRTKVLSLIATTIIAVSINPANAGIATDEGPWSAPLFICNLSTLCKEYAWLEMQIQIAHKSVLLDLDEDNNTFDPNSDMINDSIRGITISCVTSPGEKRYHTKGVVTGVDPGTTGDIQTIIIGPLDWELEITNPTCTL